MRALVLGLLCVLSFTTQAVSAQEAPAPEAELSCNARSVDGCLCLKEDKVFRMVAQLKVYKEREKNPPPTNWWTGILALVGSLVGILVKGTF